MPAGCPQVGGPGRKGRFRIEPEYCGHNRGTSFRSPIVPNPGAGERGPKGDVLGDTSQSYCKTSNDFLEVNLPCILAAEWSFGRHIAPRGFVLTSTCIPSIKVDNYPFNIPPPARRSSLEKPAKVCRFRFCWNLSFLLAPNPTYRLIQDPVLAFLAKKTCQRLPFA
jgi:hypothetical protein